MKPTFNSTIIAKNTFEWSSHGDENPYIENNIHIKTTLIFIHTLPPGTCSTKCILFILPSLALLHNPSTDTHNSLHMHHSLLLAFQVLLHHTPKSTEELLSRILILV